MLSFMSTSIGVRSAIQTKLLGPVSGSPYFTQHLHPTSLTGRHPVHALPILSLEIQLVAGFSKVIR